MIISNESMVAKFYTNKSIFVTGGTGFLGMVIVEKLLFSCSEIKNIYMLVKPRKEESVQERIEKIFSLEAFLRLKRDNPGALKKIIPVAGDLLKDDLGISEKDMENIRKEDTLPRLTPRVFVVIHSAASVNLVAPFEDAITINTRSTVKMLELSKTIQNLQVFVYISSAYSNSNKNVIDEKVYDPEISLKSLDYLLEELNNNPMSEIAASGWPNTYTYSKALAESLVAAEVQVPAAIVRPSIITAAHEEPTPGWLYGWSGGSRALAGIGQGAILVWHGDDQSVCDIIPVDVVANLTIAAAWDVCRNRDAHKSKVKVFNSTCGLQNPMTLGQLFYTGLEYGKSNYKRQGIPKLFVIKNPVVWQILFFLLQVIPAYIFSGLGFLFGKWGSSVVLLRKLRQLMEAVGFFTRHQFIFVDYNVRQLYLDLNDTDKETFNFDVKRIDWHHYIMERFMFGIRKYLQRDL